MRSLLLVPMADAAAIDPAFQSGADALVFDLADLAPAERERARANAHDVLRSLQIEAERPHIYLRLSDLNLPAFDQDLAALVGNEPDGILLAGSLSGADVQHLGAKLAVQEAEYGLSDGELGIIAEVAGSATALFALGSYAGKSARLIGLTWDAERLALDIGSQHQDGDAADGGPLQTARHMTLFAARSAEVAAIDSAGLSRASNGFEAECKAARRYGFNAKLATSPEEIAVINGVFGYEDQ